MNLDSTSEILGFSFERTKRDKERKCGMESTC